MAEPKPSFNPNPRKPRIKLPAGACDTHFHVFGPRARFPFAADRSYTPPADAPKETLFALHKHLGIERGVVVQSAVHQFDNTAAADLLAANRNYRGVALLPASTPAADGRSTSRTSTQTGRRSGRSAIGSARVAPR